MLSHARNGAQLPASACKVPPVHAGDADIGEHVSLDEVAPAVSVTTSDCACLLIQVNIGAGTITCNYGEALCVSPLHLQQYLLLAPCCHCSVNTACHCPADGVNKHRTVVSDNVMVGGA